MVVASGRVPMNTSFGSNRFSSFEPRSPYIDGNGGRGGRGARGVRGARGGRGGRGGNNLIHKKIRIKSGTYKGYVGFFFF